MRTDNREQREGFVWQVTAFALGLSLWALTSGLSFVCWVFVQDLNTYFVSRFAISAPNIDRTQAAEILQLTQYFAAIVPGIIMGMVFIVGFDFYSRHFGKPIIWSVTRRILTVEFAIIVLWMLVIRAF